MARLENLNGHIPMILIVGILIIVAGFIVIGCGTDPQFKIQNPDKAQCAVDFSLDTTDTAALISGNANYPSIAGNNLTVEAWVKPGAPTSTDAQGIFARFGSAGATLYVEGGKAKFALRQFTPSPPAASTSTDYTVSSITTMTEGTWYHLAGVVSNTAHTHAVTASCTPTVMAETPHLDILVDGTFEDCATTWNVISFTKEVAGEAHTTTMHPVETNEDGTEVGTCTSSVMADPSHLDLFVNGTLVNCSKAQNVISFTEPQGVTNPSVFGGAQDVNTSYIGFQPTSVQGSTGGQIAGVQFQGTIDEVRMWTEARSSDDIFACKEAELTSSAACALDSDILKGYWKMNECEGSDVNDWSGAGSSGGIEMGSTAWTGGFVTSDWPK